MSWQGGCLARQLYRTRPLSTALHFYQNRQLDVYAAKEAHRLTLRQLVHLFAGFQSAPAHPVPCQVFFGRQMDKDRLIKASWWSLLLSSSNKWSYRVPTMSALNYPSE